jgi:hypothetical protein
VLGRPRAGLGVEPGRPLPQRRRRWIWAIVAVVAIAASITALPYYLLSRAEKRAAACFQTLIAEGAGSPASCQPQPWELGLAEQLPWFQEDAVRLEADSRYRAAYLDYAMASAIVPDAGARRRAIVALSGLGRGAHEPPDGLPALEQLEGAFAETAEIGARSDDKRIRGYVLRSALAVAALDELRALTKNGDATEANGLNLRRGATACLLGDRAEGGRELRAADVHHRSVSPRGDGLDAARVGLVACGHTGAVDDVDPRLVHATLRPALAALDAAARAPGSLDRVRAVLDDAERPLTGEQRLRLAAFVIENERPDALETLALLAPRHGEPAALPIDELRTPWLVLAPETAGLLVLADAPAAEATATHIEALRAGLAAAPLVCAGPECPAQAALDMPAPVLAEAARMAWIEAAAAHARRGAAEPARVALQRATALTTERRRHQSAPLLLAVGDAQGVVDLLAADVEALGDQAPAVQTLVLTNQALALAHLGRWDAAHAAAEQAFAAARRAERDVHRDADPSLAARRQQREDLAAAAWLWAALSVKAGKAADVQAALEDEGSEEAAEAAEWLELQQLGEERRRPLRWSLSIREPAAAVLPAAMFVAGTVVPADADVEVWLDRVFHDEHRAHPVRAMLARAEAARWRGDDGAARVWTERAARMQALVTDYPTSLLAQLAELW